MKITVRVGDENAARAGINPGKYTVELGELTKDQREKLATRLYHSGEYYFWGTNNTAEAVVAELQEEIDGDAKYKIEQIAKYEKHVAAALAMTQDEYNQAKITTWSQLPETLLTEPRLTDKNTIRNEYLAKRAVEEKRLAEGKRLADEVATKILQAKHDADQAEKQRLEDIRLQQIADWVATHGTESQKARLAANLLPEPEILAAIENEAFLALAEFPRYEKLTADEVCACEDRCTDDNCHVDFRSYPAESATEGEFEKLTKIKTLMPNAQNELREHEGTSIDCENTVTRKSIRVTVKTGVLEFTREYACP